MRVKDNSPQLQREFNERLDPKARAFYLEIEDYVYSKYAVRLVITCIERTVTENEKVGGVKLSAHVKRPGYYVRALDVRAKDLSTQIITDIISHAKRVWGDMVHILAHGGTAYHIHMNVNLGYATSCPE